MSEIIQDKLGNDREILVNYVYGPSGQLLVDVFLRAPEKATIIAGALSENLMVQDDPEQPPRCDSGVDIWHIGPIELVPAVMSEDGETVITPAVVDNRHHANMRLSGPILARVDADGYPLWKLTALKWLDYGAEIVANSDETGKDLGGIEMIEGVKNPVLRCAGDA